LAKIKLLSNLPAVYFYFGETSSLKRAIWFYKEINNFSIFYSSFNTCILKSIISALILSVILLITASVYSQSSSSKPVYVIVHGAWGGGWAFKKVDSLLREKGCIVYRPTLTGQGERVHLATNEIGLYTHINDVVNTILYEDLRDIILVGHSYGGMVITGVADSLPGRIKKIIYLDALLPDNGESLLSIQGAQSQESIKKMLQGNFIIPPWVTAGKLPPKDVPHPYKTFTDTLILKNSKRLTIPATYILTVDKGKEAKDDGFFLQSERARKKGWPVLQLEADHNPQWSAPEAFVELLEKIRKN
jgi:pimeloyl-ACP methyl ester carboxylesterase